MDFSDLILEVFQTEDEEEILTEQGLLLTPLLAFAAMKKNLLKGGKFKKASALKKAQAKGKEFKEKARAAVGQTSGKGDDATVYRFTKQQIDVMSDIMSKYGKEIVKEIIDFRRQILAPYALIKRQIKGSSRVTSKDKLGMTKEEFKSALESGRKKIQARGENYFDKSEDYQQKIRKYNEQLSGLDQALKDFENGEQLSPNVVNKIYKKFDASDLKGYSAEELRRVYDDLEKNYREIIDQIEKTKAGEVDTERTKDLIKKSRELSSGKSIDLTKSEKEDFFPKGSFNVALGTYFFRRDVLDKLRPGQSNVFRDTYKSIIKEMKESISKRRRETIEKLAGMKRTVEFNDKEEKIWKKLPSVKSFSGDMKDYYQDIHEKDFQDLPQYIERSPELKEAEQKIENEIRKFERKLQKIVDAEDYKKLKQYRIINNLISLKELKDPSKLFKSSDEIKSMAKADRADDEDSTDSTEKKAYLSPDEFERKVKTILKREYDSVSELNSAKEEAAELYDIMKEQGEKDIVSRYKDIMRQIRIRRGLKPQDIKGHGTDKDILVDVDDIEKEARKIINTEYSSIDKAKQDFARLKDMIDKYKEDNEEADRNLREIDFLINRVNMKLQREVR